ncbi:MAG TPA: extracellular solute-binding protein [Planctomycetota bacterium]|nr:extracellular solute-binding protein [Planctomycetota bacterium]
MRPLPLPLAAATLLLILLVAGCGDSQKTDASKTPPGTPAPAPLKLVIYTSHGKEHYGPCLARFRKAHPEIDLPEPIDLGATDLALRIRGEAKNPQCDVWWGGPHYDFIDAEKRGLLQPYKPSWAAHSAPDNHSPKDAWYGTYLTPEVIMFNTKKLTRATAPQDWDDLLKPEWKNKIVLRDPPPSGTMKAIFAAMIVKAGGKTGVDDPAPGYDWLKQLDANTAHYASNPAEMYQYLIAGDTPVTVWNMADVYIQAAAHQSPFDCVVPASGAPVLVEGIAIPQGAPHLEAAKRFYEFITSTDELLFQANELHRIPARDDLPKDQLPVWMTANEFKPMPLDWAAIAPKADAWMDYWNHHIRTAK